MLHLNRLLAQVLFTLIFIISCNLLEILEPNKIETYKDYQHEFARIKKNYKIKNIRPVSKNLAENSIRFADKYYEDSLYMLLAVPAWEDCSHEKTYKIKQLFYLDPIKFIQAYFYKDSHSSQYIIDNRINNGSIFDYIMYDDYEKHLKIDFENVISLIQNHHNSIDDANYKSYVKEQLEFMKRYYYELRPKGFP